MATIRQTLAPRNPNRDVRPVATSRVLFDATIPRRPNRDHRPFGAGLLAYVPHAGGTSYTQADYLEYLAHVAARDAEERRAREQAARDFDQYLEERAAAYEGARLLEAGLCC